MILQHTPSRRLDASTTHRPRSFWLVALLGLPALNLVLIAVASASGPFVPVAAAFALVELVLLIALSPRYGIGVFGALAAMLGNAAITTLVPIVLFCGTGDQRLQRVPQLSRPPGAVP